MLNVEFRVLLFDLIGLGRAGPWGDLAQISPNHETRLTGVIEYGSSSAFLLLVGYDAAWGMAPRICFMWIFLIKNTLQGRRGRR